MLRIHAFFHSVSGAWLVFALAGAFGCSSGGAGSTGTQATTASSGGGEPGNAGASESGETDGASSGAPAGTPVGTNTGMLFHISAGKLVAHDVVTKKQIATSLPTRTGRLAYGDGVFTEVETPDLDSVVIHLHTFENSQFKHAVLPSLTVNGNVNSGAVPSPDGSRFVLGTRESAELGAPFLPYLNVYDLNLNRVGRIAGFSSPAWTDTRHLAAVADDGIHLIDLSAGTSRRVGPSMTAVSDLTLSPDGKMIAFMRENALWRMNLDGTRLLQLTQQDAKHFHPTWSPDGSALAVLSGVCAWTTEARVKIVLADATNQRVDDASELAGAYSCNPMKWM